MPNNLYNKVSADMILKEGAKVEELGCDLDYALAQELRRKVNEEQRKLEELKPISIKDLEIYVTI